MEGTHDGAIPLSWRKVCMGKYVAFILIAALAFGAGLLVARPAQPVRQPSQLDHGFAAVPGERGGWDLTGP
jgi:hypothetical protein